MQQDVQFVFLGTGDPQFENFLTHWASHNPQKVGAVIGFDDALAHQIEAGADAFLMPSRFEPCGLNQMYSLRYGTLPIVRRVGGLADSVVDTNADSLKAKTATGFVFDDYNANAMADVIERSITTYHDSSAWAQVMKTGMSCDWSWSGSACHYLTTYRKALERRHERALEGRQ